MPEDQTELSIDSIHPSPLLALPNKILDLILSLTLLLSLGIRKM